jgi:hypothetical protein
MRDHGGAPRSSPNRRARSRSQWMAVGIAAVLSALPIACNAKAAAIEVTCPAPKTSVFAAADISSSTDTPDHRHSLEAGFDRAITMAAKCTDVEAHLVVFASGPGDSTVIYDGTPRGIGQNGRARAQSLRVTVLPNTLAQVHKALQVTASGRAGSDPLAGFDLLTDYAATRPGRKLVATISSDGVSTSSRLPLDHPLASADMAKASTVAVAAVDVVSLTMSGVGATAPPPPPADYVAELRTFWTTVCKRVSPMCVVTSEVPK